MADGDVSGRGKLNPRTVSLTELSFCAGSANNFSNAGAAALFALSDLLLPQLLSFATPIYLAYGVGDTSVMQRRYLFYFLGLLAVASTLALCWGAPFWLAHLLTNLCLAQYRIGKSDMARWVQVMTLLCALVAVIIPVAPLLFELGWMVALTGLLFTAVVSVYEKREEIITCLKQKCDQFKPVVRGCDLSKLFYNLGEAGNILFVPELFPRLAQLFSVVPMWAGTIIYGCKSLAFIASILKEVNKSDYRGCWYTDQDVRREALIGLLFLVGAVLTAPIWANPMVQLFGWVAGLAAVWVMFWHEHYAEKPANNQEGEPGAASDSNDSKLGEHEADDDEETIICKKWSRRCDWITVTGLTTYLLSSSFVPIIPAIAPFLSALVTIATVMMVVAFAGRIINWCCRKQLNSELLTDVDQRMEQFVGLPGEAVKWLKPKAESLVNKFTVFLLSSPSSKGALSGVELVAQAS